MVRIKKKSSNSTFKALIAYILGAGDILEQHTQGVCGLVCFRFLKPLSSTCIQYLAEFKKKAGKNRSCGSYMERIK